MPHRKKKKLFTKCYTGPRNWTRGESLEHYNGTTGSIKGREFLDKQSDYWLL